MNKKLNKYLYEYYAKNYTKMSTFIDSEILTKDEFELLFKYVINKNDAFSKFFVFNELKPEQLEQTFSSSEIAFFNIEKINKLIYKNLNYLKPLSSIIAKFDDLSINKIKKLSKNKIIAYYLLDSKFFLNILDNLKKNYIITNTLSKDIQDIKDNYEQELNLLKNKFAEKKRDVSRKKKLSHLLLLEKKEMNTLSNRKNKNISKLFPKKAYLTMKKCLVKEIITKSNFSLNNENHLNENKFYDISLRNTLDGNYKILNNRYLYGQKETTFEIYDIRDNQKKELYFDDFEMINNSIIIFQKEVSYHKISNSISSENFVKNKLQFSFIFFLKILFIFIYFGFLFYVFQAVLLKVLLIFLIFTSIKGIIKNHSTSQNFFSWKTEKVEREKRKSQSNNNGISKRNIIKYILGIELGMKIKFCDNEKLIMEDNNFIKIYDINNHKFKKRKHKFKDIVGHKVVIDKKSELEKLDNELMNILANLTDVDKIQKTKKYYDKKKSYLIELKQVIDILYFEKKQYRQNLETDNLLSQIFEMSNTPVNNFVIDRLTYLELQIPESCFKFLKNKCNEKILLKNFNIPFNEFSIDKILNNISGNLSREKYLSCELIINKLFLGNPKEININKLYKIKKQISLNDTEDYLSKRIDKLIKIVGKISNNIEISNEQNSRSKDIEISK